MTNEEIDRILSSKEEDAEPSPGLVASVMETIRSEASAPPPIPFPWKRALPGVAAAAFALVWLLTLVLSEFARGAALQPPGLSWPAWWAPTAEVLGWGVVALLLSLISVKISMRLVSR